MGWRALYKWNIPGIMWWLKVEKVITVMGLFIACWVNFMVESIRKKVWLKFKISSLTNMTWKDCETWFTTANRISILFYHYVFIRETIFSWQICLYWHMEEIWVQEQETNIYKHQSIKKNQSWSSFLPSKLSFWRKIIFFKMGSV